MTNKEKVKIVNLISELDIAVGKLAIPAVTSGITRSAKEQVGRVSYELSNMME